MATLDEIFVGHRIVGVEGNILTLDNGIRVEFEKECDSCCAWFRLESLATTDNIITSITEEDEYEEGREGEGPYTARIVGVTDAGSVDIAYGVGDATNGYYLSGFCLDIRVI
jgi:hypothetical protein